MKKHILILLLAIFPATSFAAGAGVHLDAAPIDINDKDSIKRGAKNFANYCFSCHSAHFMRFNRIAKDTGMTEAEIREMMIFTRDEKGEATKTGDLMKVAMTAEYAKSAFGIAVPDLSLAARARGADWLYTYLRTFYVDENRPTGMNNLAFPDVAMPNVLMNLQGINKAVYADDGHGGTKIEGLESIQAGAMTTEEFDAFAADLVNFMVYLAEPVQADRRSLGWKVLLFLAIFFVFAYLLKKEYWKDVH